MTDMNDKTLQAQAAVSDRVQEENAELREKLEAGGDELRDDLVRRAKAWLVGMAQGDPPESSRDIVGDLAQCQESEAELREKLEADAIEELHERAEKAEKERDFLVSEYERAVKCEKLGFAHAAAHIFNAIVNARCDANADRFIQLMERAEKAEAERDDLRGCLEGTDALLASASSEADDLREKLEKAEAERDEVDRLATVFARAKDDLKRRVAELESALVRAEAELDKAEHRVSGCCPQSEMLQRRMNEMEAALSMPKGVTLPLK